MAKRKTNASKKVLFFFWKNDAWHREYIDTLWPHDNQLEKLKHLTEQWLNLLHDEYIIPRHIHLEGIVMSSPESEAYLSFSHTLFSNEWSIIQKWSIVEGLIRTIENTGLPLHTMRLLVQHHEMADQHLDLSQPIPLQLFLS